MMVNILAAQFLRVEISNQQSTTICHGGCVIDRLAKSRYSSPMIWMYLEKLYHPQPVWRAQTVCQESA